MKSLKFPLTERPFGGAVELTPKQCKAYHAVTRKIVASTYRKFDAFVREDNRVMDTAKWKPVKTREEVTVYKQLHCKPAEETKPGSQMYETLWRMPKLVAVGTVAGSLDDIMYGIVSPDAASIRIKTSYTHNELLDGAVLREIKTASEKDPFRFLGLKWMAKGHPGVVNAVVRPRDFVFVESTGVNKLKDGTRVGFHVIHSVELPQCPELTSYSIIRARSSSCYLYRQLKPGVVEIYLTSRSDPGGNAPETIAIMSAANTLIGIWKAVWCAQNKKLTWALKNEAARQRCRDARDIDAASHSTTSDDQHFCNVCARKAHVRTFRGGSSNAKCRLCSAWVCVPCRVARKLSTVDDTLELRQQVVEVCVRCMASVEMTDSLSVAHRQYVPSTDDTIESEKPTQSPIACDTGSVGSDPAEEDRDTVGEEAAGKPERVKIETIDDWQCRIMVMGSLPVSSRALTEL